MIRMRWLVLGITVAMLAAASAPPALAQSKGRKAANDLLEHEVAPATKSIAPRVADVLKKAFGNVSPKTVLLGSGDMSHQPYAKGPGGVYILR
jgi:hypothetical protein